MKRKMFLIVAATVLLFVQSAFAQADELPDTVWTKFTYPNAVNAVKFTPDGKYLASGGDDGIPKLWDAETGELIRVFHGNDCKIWSLDINNTGEMLAIVNDSSEIFIWNLEKGGIIKIIDYYKEFGGRSNGRCVTFSHNGRYLASLLSHNGKTSTEHDLVLFDVNNWNKITDISDIAVPFNVDFSPNDQLLAASNLVFGEKRIAIGIFQVPSLNLLRKLNEYENSSISVKFSPDGKYLAAAMSGSPNKVWNTSDWKLEKEFGDNSYSICYSKDNQFIIIGGGQPTNRHVYIRNAKTYDLIYTYPKSNVPTSVDVSPNNKFIAASLMTSGIIVYNAKWNPTSVSDNPIQITESLIFPNPANQTANIRFNLLKPSQINISIFDINSKKISNIYDGFLEQGLQTFSWNVSQVLSGTYFAQITANGITSSIKIVVEK